MAADTSGERPNHFLAAIQALESGNLASAQKHFMGPTYSFLNDIEAAGISPTVTAKLQQQWLDAVDKAKAEADGALNQFAEERLAEQQLEALGKALWDLKLRTFMEMQRKGP